RPPPRPTGCPCPPSLLPPMPATRAVGPGRSEASSPSRSTLPVWSTRARVSSAPRSATAQLAASRTAWCSTAEATRWRAPGSRAGTVPLTARLSASVPPEADTPRDGPAPRRGGRAGWPGGPPAAPGRGEGRGAPPAVTGRWRHSRGKARDEYANAAGKRHPPGLLGRAGGEGAGWEGDALSRG